MAEQYSPLVTGGGLTGGVPEQYSPLVQRMAQPPSMLEARSSLISRLGSGQAVDPKEIQATDQQATTLLDEGMKGLRRFLYSTTATGQGFAGAMIAPFAPETGQNLINQGLRTQQEMPQELAPAVQNWSDVHDLRSGALKFASAVGEGLPSSALAVGAGLLGRGIGGGLAARAGLRGAALEAAAARGGYGAGMLSMLPQEGGETALDLAQDPTAMANTTAAQRAGLVFGRGTVNAALENIVPQALVVPHLLGKAARIAPGLGAGLRNVALLAGEGALGEYGTEFAQELTGQAAQRYANPATQWDLQKAHEAGLSGAATGLFLGGAGGAGQAVHSNLAQAGDLVGRGVDKVREALPKAPTFDDLVGHVQRYAADPAAAGRDLADGTLFGIAKAAEAAGALKQYGIKGINTAEDVVSNTYDSMAKFVARHIEDPEKKAYFAQKAAELKTMTMPEWEIVKQMMNDESTTGARFIEGLGTAGTLAAQKAVERGKGIASWLGQAAQGAYDRLTQGAEGQRASIRAPDTEDRAAALKQIYDVSPGLKAVTDKLAETPNERRQLANFLHVAINDAQFLNRPHDQQYSQEVLKRWTQATGTDLSKILDAARAKRNIQDLGDLASSGLYKAMLRLNINPQLHDNLLALFATTTGDYANLSKSQKDLLFHLTGKNELKARDLYQSIISSEDKGQKVLERKIGEAGQVKSFLKNFGEQQTGEGVTGMAANPDYKEGNVGVDSKGQRWIRDSEGNLVNAQSDLISPFNQEAFKRALATEKYTSPRTSIPITLQPQGEHKDLDPHMLANAFGKHVGDERAVGDKAWEPYKKGEARWTKADGLQLKVSPMSLVNMVRDHRFRDQFAEHMIGFEDRPGASEHEQTGQRFMNVLSTLVSNGIHVDPEAVGLPEGSGPVHVKVNMNMDRLHRDLIINQTKNDPHPLTWGDISGADRGASSPAAHIKRLDKFEGDFTGAYNKLKAEGEKGNAVSKKIAGVIWHRAREGIRKAEDAQQFAPIRNPSPAELDKAAAEYHDALPGLAKAREDQATLHDARVSINRAYRDEVLTADDLYTLMDWFSSEKGGNLTQVQSLLKTAGLKIKKLDRATMDTSKLAAQIGEDMTRADEGREEFEAGVTGSPLSAQAEHRKSVVQAWIEHKFSPAQRVQRSREAMLKQKEKEAAAAKPPEPSKQPPQLGGRIAITWKFEGKDALKRSAAKYIVTAVEKKEDGTYRFSFKNEDTGKVYKDHTATAEGKSTMEGGNESSYYFLPPSKTAALAPVTQKAEATAAPTKPVPTGTAQKVAGHMQRLLDAHVRNVQSLIDRMPEGAARSKAVQALKTAHDKLVKALKEGVDVLEAKLAGGMTPTEAINRWTAAIKTELAGKDGPLQDRNKQAAERNARFEEIIKSTPQKEIGFADNSKAYSHDQLNSVMQGWAKKYLPGKNITLHIFDAKPGDANGFVWHSVVPNTIFLPNKGTTHLSTLSTMAHEFGHLLQYNAYDNASKAVQRKIFAAYKADMKALSTGTMTNLETMRRFGSARMAHFEAVTGGKEWEKQISAMSLAASLETGDLSATRKYEEPFMQFNEWLANQFSKHITQGARDDASPAEKKFWAKLAETLKAFYEDVVKRLKPNTEYQKWVESLAVKEKQEEGPPDIPFSTGGEEEAPPTGPPEVPFSTGEVKRRKIRPPPEAPPSPPPPPPPKPPKAAAAPGGGKKKPRLTAAQKRFIAVVERIMGNKVAVQFNQALEGGVEGTFQTKRELLDRIGNERRAAVEALRNATGKRYNELSDRVKALDAEEQKALADQAVQGFIKLASGMEKKNGLAEHETFHAAFHIFFNPEEKRVLATAFTKGLAGRRLREIFKDDPVVLKRIDDSAEEAAAYAFQVWAENPDNFQLGPKVETMFQRMLNFIRKIFGVMTNEEKADIILKHLASGERFAKAVSPVARKLDKDQAWQDRAQNLAKDVGGLLKGGFDILFTPAYRRMVDSHNPAMAKIADLMYQPTGAEGNAGGMIQRGRLEYKKQLNRLGAIFKDLTEDEMKQLHEAMVLDKAPTDPKLTERADALHQWYKDMYQYQVGAGVRLNDAGIKQNYYPLTWDPEKVLANKKAFIDMLNDNYAKELLTTKKTPNEIYDSITSYLERGEDLVNVMGADLEPISESTKSRTLAFITREHRLPFMSEDPAHTAFRYAKQAVRQAEYVRSFGMKSSKLEALKTEAKIYGRTPEELALINDFVDGAMGNKEIGMSRELKDLYGAMNVYQNYRLLPFSLFSSIIDPMGIAIRSGRVTDAWETFTYSMKNLFKEWKKDYPRDFWEKYAEDMGVIEHSGTSSNANNLYDGNTMRGTSKMLNDKLFKYNLLNGWVRNNTIMATKAAQRSFYRAAEGDMGKHSARYLEELGLTKEDVHYDPAQDRILLRADELEAAGLSKDEAAETAGKLSNAVDKFVRQSLLNPSSAELPVWASNPYLMPVAHLKQFVFAFNATITDRVLHELEHGNFKPAALAASYVPAMIGIDFIKDMIVGFGNEPPYKKDWGAFDYFNSGLSRSGLTGIGQFFSSAQEDVVRGGSGLESAAGPAAQQAQQAVKAFSSGDNTAIKNWMVKAMPLQAGFKQYLTSPEHSTGRPKGGSSGLASVAGLADDVALAIAR